jgi:hypothetical protein
LKKQIGENVVNVPCALNFNSILLCIKIFELGSRLKITAYIGLLRKAIRFTDYKDKDHKVYKDK